jgi:sugar lactone lactonase YvrE
MKTNRNQAILAAFALSTGLAFAKPNPETVARFNGPMPTGLAVSRHNRIFVNYPRWGDNVTFSVAEIKNGQAVAYPNAAFNRLDATHPEKCLVSVQSVVMDGKDRLWILDTGSIQFKTPLAGGPKLVAVDLGTDKVVRTISFPRAVCLPTSYLNDVRFDLSRGKAGYAYLTDSSDSGPNAIIVLDLASGRSWRRLNDHPSVKHEAIVISVEGKPLVIRLPKHKPKNPTFGSDGVALSPDGQTLYYCSLIGHHLYSVSTAALTDESKNDEAMGGSVKDLGARDFASDGLLCDTRGRLYLTDLEHNAVRRGAPGTKNLQIIATDPKMVWPDSMAIGGNGYLYFTCNQINRQGLFHDGKDMRVKPYRLYRVKVDAAQANP